MFFERSAQPRLYFYFCMSLYFVSAVFTPISGNDWQRVAQSVVSLLCCFALVSSGRHESRAFLDKVTVSLGTVVLGLGLLSIWKSHQPQWALVELAVLLSSCCIVSAFALERARFGQDLDRILISFVIFLCAVKSLQFIAALAAALFSGIATLDSTLLFEGFSNRRFYGQFQTFTLPLLALPLLLAATKISTKFWVFLLLGCWWMMAIAGGSRGTWLGMACAAIFIFCCCGAGGRRWFRWQITAAATGLALFLFFFSFLPGYMNVEVTNFAGDRLNTSLSAREIIWQQAWEMIKARPLLGFGPMHFADIHNQVAAHPHQIFLQWACEWGIPSTLLVTGPVARGLLATLQLIRKRIASSGSVDILRICLFGSLLGALTQAMVDGVIVMPYSQLWMALVVGWLMGIHEWSSSESANVAFRWCWSATLILAVGLLMYTVVRDFPDLDRREDQYGRDFGGILQPRFWQQGVIAESPP
ncbi:O-antigen ligase family protein [Pseudomonas petrae]|uniref:O-antigen ligase family protein n=1 Tax=Pseudomonas petrae TaxID=2912190 RepID=UPI001F1C872C|nr:O-antigen ligase family protein [Pseudomonas petrae]MCF7556700.1 O-antigen ligase family protein [Pseudomonas petrae]